ncbi:MAG: L,D-transpeptidase family protein [Pseudomonadales bacterium]
MMAAAARRPPAGPGLPAAAKLLAGLLALLLLAVLPDASARAQAQEAVVVSLINHFESAHIYGELRVHGVDITDHELLARFYEQRRFEPVWVFRGREGRQARRLRDAIAVGERHGLDPRRYHLAEADAAAAEGDWGAVELLLSEAFVRQGRHRARGVVDPASVDPEWRMARSEPDGLALLEAVARGANAQRLLDRLWPESREYWQLLAARLQLLDHIDEPPPAPIGGGALLRPGMEDPRVPLLRERLLGSADPDRFYDLQLTDAVIAFQRSQGLEPDGAVGPRTLAALNRTVAQQVRQIDANLERWRWLPEAFPDTYVRVNIADFRLLAVSKGHVDLDMPVIVGLPYRQTPVFTETMKYLVFNPYWEVPRRLAVQDQLPKLRADAHRMAELGFEAAPIAGGPMEPVDRIDWQTVTASQFPYHLRQQPGPANPLGRVKFMLPNEYAVYLHDTPTRGLFDRVERTFSSGCIRVGDALALAEWVLGGQRESWDATRIVDAMDTGATRTVVLEEPIPVFVVYFTAQPAASGTIALQFDVYGRDARIIAALYDEPQ